MKPIHLLLSSLMRADEPPCARSAVSKERAITGARDFSQESRRSEPVPVSQRGSAVNGGAETPATMMV
jgi:hypothetical protein